MSDVYIPSFFTTDPDPKGGALTYEQLQARRKIAMALATRNRGFPKTIGEGLTYFGESLGDMFADKKMAANEAAYRQQSAADVQRLSQPDTAAPPPTVAPAGPGDGPGPMDPAINPFGAAGPAVAPQVAAQDAADPMNAMALASPADLANARRLQQQPEMTIEEWKARVARNESGGRRDPYSAIGVQSRRGDYPYGKYQVMGARIGPWTKEHLGRELTPRQFLNDPDAQEAVASGQGAKYIAQFGPQDAAAAWFAGPNGFRDPTRKDTLGTHVAEYRRRFNQPLPGDREALVASAAGASPVAAFAPSEQESAAPIQLASLSGAPMPDTAPAPDAREAITRSLVAQQQPAPVQAPPPQQVAQVQPGIAPAPPIGTPVPSRVTGPPTGPPKMPDPTPMTPREMEIRRRIGSTSDENFKGQLQPIVDRMAEERKFKDAQNMKAWEKEDAAWIKRTDPMQRAQLEKAQREEAEAARERLKTEARGGVSQAVIDKGLEESAKKIAPLREGSIALNEVDDLIEKGMFSGTLAKGEQAWAKLKMAGGGAVDPRVANTERFAAAIAPIIAAARTSLAGTANISDADMRAAEKASGGDITLTKEGMQGVMKTVRQLQLNAARHHQQLLSTAAGGDPGAERTLYGIHGLPMENIVSKNDRSVERLMQNPDNEHERGLFDKSWHTPGLAEKIIARQRAR